MSAWTYNVAKDHTSKAARPAWVAVLHFHEVRHYGYETPAGTPRASRAIEDAQRFRTQREAYAWGAKAVGHLNEVAEDRRYHPGTIAAEAALIRHHRSGRDIRPYEVLELVERLAEALERRTRGAG